ncbi:MAG TPA: PASTA domain-containing protein [Terriglobia bacterium]|jgi:beta-lactam-binding protein with PASTA domain|nr:PASTA domain-containing protein [Terriglobia bacterium]
MALLSRIRSIFRLFVLFTVLAAVALLSAITTIRVTIHSGEEKAPNLVGLALEDAEHRAGGMGLGIKVEDHLFSSKYAENHIVSQAPPPGDSTKSGQDIHVLVSLGTPRVTVPDLVGQSVRAAQVTAVQQGLTLGDVVTVHWSGVGADGVVAQEPPPTSQPARSPAVNLLISLGEPTPAFVCPDFVGMTLARARNQITAAGFTMGDVQTPAPATPAPAPGSPTPGSSGPGLPTPPAPAASANPSGTIVSQTPAPGSKISAGTAFNFTVSP